MHIYKVNPFTCTLDSGKLILSATSSRINMSGYLVRPNNDSNISNCARVNVVLSRLCFLGLPVQQLFENDFVKLSHQLSLSSARNPTNFYNKIPQMLISSANKEHFTPPRLAEMIV